MSAWQLHPQDWEPHWTPLPGYTSLEHLQQELGDRHRRHHPPAEFDPAWMIEPTICKPTPTGVEMWKWKISRDAWILDCVIEWRDE